MNVFEYICLDNENKFRSKIIVSSNSIKDVEPIVVSSSLIESNVNIYDVVLYPVKVIRNPFYRDECHWIVLTECKYPNNTLHKSNTRSLLEHTINDDNFREIGIAQDFVLFENNKPLGWNDNYDLVKNNTGKNEYSQHSEKLVNTIIEALLYSEIPVESATMVQLIGKWQFAFKADTPLEACDKLILFRYIAQRICFQQNVIFSLHSDPVNNKLFASRCEFSISTEEMRDTENGLREIVDICEKIKLKHLNQYSVLSQNNSKKFTYSQRNDEQCIQVVMQEENSGFIRDKRCASDCDPYKVLELLISTMTNSYNINMMNHDLESLKERFNYSCIIGTSKLNTLPAPLKQTRTINKKTKTKSKSKTKGKGFTGLSDILNLSNNTDE
jgi:glutamine synthetase